MNKVLFKQKGQCQNCKEKDCELESIIMAGKKKEVCDACAEGYRIEKNGKETNLDI